MNARTSTPKRICSARVPARDRSSLYRPAATRMISTRSRHVGAPQLSCSSGKPAGAMRNPVAGTRKPKSICDRPTGDAGQRGGAARRRAFGRVRLDPERVTDSPATDLAPRNCPMNAESLHDLFVDELKDVYNAEKQLVRALPRMARAASNPQLRKAFEQHLRQTEGHVARLERIFKELGAPARGKRCKGMEGLIEEGKEVMEEHEGSVLDAGLISAGQRVEHYEIAAYGCLRTYAQLLG